MTAVTLIRMSHHYVTCIDNSLSTDREAYRYCQWWILTICGHKHKILLRILPLPNGIPTPTDPAYPDGCDQAGLSPLGALRQCPPFSPPQLPKPDHYINSKFVQIEAIKYLIADNFRGIWFQYIVSKKM
ncbi:hypothetical protein AVEN_13407-1 [Araneus ventricosus]|uniref:Uncharacterized protein n=1 Tax=Araneus ventricosus TaxID=182803 RepID=A0A4Y2UVB3_ARAVE|nr:hypothetical protein AVEN_27550-1 [Araneus ventricosus]GBO16935.1 hypothetical protein AVEN_13407-1 [Araneus ventricosus]